ncbi:siderophore-interacting protein [Streptomyces hoynatensis]|uniref:Siderophore-interacting protein n=1 Tax=Streptomyces hoynatensis TaxID=1141874 RepID=A0A3A9Z5D0_9ACTN|nr:siderophore-interacting protein [Streptomyces hoynatensis]RKN43712.1 siderophore-interacting protein [Streptomyces hoynatensis]
MSRASFGFFDLRVTRAARISPSFVRVTLGGAELAGFASGGRDQRVKLFLPRPGCREVRAPREAGEDWWPAWQRMHPEERAMLRTYTVREQRPAAGEVDIDFVVHGDTGVATRWARAAAPGDPVTVLGPVAEDNPGVLFRLPPGTDWVLLAGDASALPAVSGILRWLPAGLPVRVFLDVPHAADRRELPTRADAEIIWLCGDRPGPRPADPLTHAVRHAAWPKGRPYAWLAGESGQVRALRRHLVNDRATPRSRVTFTGYWRRDASEDTLIQEAITAAA